MLSSLQEMQLIRLFVDARELEFSRSHQYGIDLCSALEHNFIYSKGRNLVSVELKLKSFLSSDFAM